jgi:hypothetical protein
MAKRSAAMPQQDVPVPGCAGLGHAVQPQVFGAMEH